MGTGARGTAARRHGASKKSVEWTDRKPMKKTGQPSSGEYAAERGRNPGWRCRLESRAQLSTCRFPHPGHVEQASRCPEFWSAVGAVYQVQALFTLLPKMHPILTAVARLRHLHSPPIRPAYPGVLSIYEAMALPDFWLRIDAIVQEPVLLNLFPI
ncbi:uncharacterized protein N7459_002919 [Penicillium hispanicum]|uniref:uncharacterized protein n=1 Tax=Penicillium hispanicum TaxID=1080232 RepID=UPI00253FF187|nr:uncharacterized protein N7459_002919 [Penicillium hispanicum]KAJ5587154.1 hypothetical protein N7459_002919 [Penicillium hispanicum]